MSSQIIAGLLFAFEKNLDYGRKLVADLDDDQMVAQPASDPDAPANHPAWVLSHLNVYLPVMQAVILGESFPDPRDHEFGMLSKPLPGKESYASKSELIAEFESGHQAVAKLLGDQSNDVFDKAIELPRWKEVMPTAGYALPYLMCNHENIHLGQVSAWRRIQGLPSV